MSKGYRFFRSFQEIVPLNAGNVLVLGDNEPAAKWLAMINQSLNKSSSSSSSSGGRLSSKTPSFGAGSMFFAKPSLKKISESFRTDCRRKLKICNCSSFSEEIAKRYGRESCFRCPESLVNQAGPLSDDEEDEDDDDEDEDEDEDEEGGDKVASLVSNQMMKYGLVASKQMVGIFLTVWMRKELIQHVTHLRISCVTRGIMGCLGNKVQYFDNSHTYKPKTRKKKNSVSEILLLIIGMHSCEFAALQDELLLHLQSSSFW